MARRRLRIAAVVATEDRRGVRILTANPDATRGGVDELELTPREAAALIAQLAETLAQVDDLGDR